MSVFIAGAGGQVGREAAALADSGAVVTSRAELDITDEGAVRAALKAARPDVVLNLAAYTAVDRAEAERDAAFAVNRDGAAILAAAAADVGAAVIYLSTDYVFDGRKVGAYREDDPTCPQGVYGESKAAGEAATAAANSRHLILRTSWVFGRYGGNFVKTMLRLSESRSALSVVDDQRGCPTPADDLARASLHLAQACLAPGFDAWGVYHYCGYAPVTWCAFAREVFAAAGRDVAVSAITTAEFGAPAPRPANSVLDCTKTGRTFGLVPADWREGLERVVRAPCPD